MDTTSIEVQMFIISGQLGNLSLKNFAKLQILQALFTV
ncbi:hypothetical protein NIES2104_51080 [Leptolyngbya sp. NIES-2104]|nr:hypothetical protein NIES2104_51080 [Leptolyngbya sp. NIES-2104]